MIQYIWAVKRGIKRTPNVFAYAYPNKCYLFYSFPYHNHANNSTFIFMSPSIDHLLFIFLAFDPSFFPALSLSSIHLSLYLPFSLHLFTSHPLFLSVVELLGVHRTHSFY